MRESRSSESESEPREAIELVIFDCDGVLVDSEPISNRMLAEALTAAGLPTSFEQALDEFKGLLLSDVQLRAEAELGAPLPAGWVEAYEQERAQTFRDSLEAMPGAYAAVKLVKEAGIAVCVASQGKRSKTELTLRLTGLRELFATDALFSAETVPRGKPFPDLFLHAASTIGVAPARCVVIEDTTLGVRAAVAAGMPVFGYDPEGQGEALRAAGASPFSSHDELAGLLGLG